MQNILKTFQDIVEFIVTNVKWVKINGQKPSDNINSGKEQKKRTKCVWVAEGKKKLNDENHVREDDASSPVDLYIITWAA